MLALVAVSLFTASSCTKTCDEGYEGDDCKTAIREKFLGSFKGNEICGTGNDNYTIAIAASGTDILKINLGNVYNQNLTVTATVEGTSFSVASQQPAVGVTVSGTGSVSGNNITFTYNINDGTNSNNCTFTGTKL